MYYDELTETENQLMGAVATTLPCQKTWNVKGTPYKLPVGIQVTVVDFGDRSNDPVIQIDDCDFRLIVPWSYLKFAPPCDDIAAKRIAELSGYD